MTVDEKIERLTDLVGSISSGVKTLTGTVETLATTLETLASTVIAHDNQIEALIKISEENASNWKNLERQWLAYLNTLPRQ